MNTLYKQVTKKLHTRHNNCSINIPKYGKFTVAELELVVTLAEHDRPLNHVPNQDPLYKLYLGLIYDMYDTEGNRRTDTWFMNQISDMERILHRLQSTVYAKAKVDELYAAVLKHGAYLYRYYDGIIPIELSNRLIQLQQDLNSFKQVFKDE